MDSIQVKSMTLAYGLLVYNTTTPVVKLRQTVLTGVLKSALSLIEVRVLDHIIVGI